MTKNPVLIRGWKKYKEEQARIKDDGADQIQKIKEYYAEERERLKRNGTSRRGPYWSSTGHGTPILFPGSTPLKSKQKQPKDLQRLISSQHNP